MAIFKGILKWIFGRKEVPPVVFCPDHLEDESSGVEDMTPQEEETEPESAGIYPAEPEALTEPEAPEPKAPAEAPEKPLEEVPAPDAEQEKESLEAWRRERLRRLRGI